MVKRKLFLQKRNRVITFFKISLKKSNHKKFTNCLYSFVVIIAIVGCASNKIPKKKYNQYNYSKNYSYKSDTLRVSIVNPLKCALRIFLSSDDSFISEKFKKMNPIILSSESDTTITLSTKKTKSKIYFSSLLGDPNKKIIYKPIGLPFSRDKKYKIIQGYNGKVSHNNEYSRYAIDFDLKERDTVYAASDGFVVGIVKDYKYGGWGKKWLPYSNFITIYHSKTGLFTQYVHLYYDSSFVKHGDPVKKGQPIGLAGKTGMTNIEHLHFNTLIPVNTAAGLKSVPVDFEKKN